MNWLAEHWLQLVLIAGYLAMLVHHALAGRKVSGNVDGYLVAGRNLGGFVIAMSFYATFMSTNTFIGAAGKSWQHGLTWCLGGVVLTALAWLSWLVVAPRFVPLTRRYHSLTVADFLGTHYQSDSVRRVAGLIAGVSSVLYLVAIYRGAALAIETFLELPYAWCVVITALIVTGYTLTGGFKSVVMTDAVQGVLMLIGAVALFVAVWGAAGGWSAISERLGEVSPRLASWTDGTAASAALAYGLAVGVKYLVEPRQLSRFYGLRDDRALRTAAWIAPLVILVSYFCLMPLGAMAHAVLSPEAIDKTDEVVPYLLGPANLLGPLVGTLFLLVLLSAAMSSIDSVLLVAAATLSRDVVRLAAVGEDAQHAGDELNRTRWGIVVVSLVAAGTALLPFTRDIVEMTKFSGSLYGACFVPLLIVGLFQTRRSSAAAMATLILGSATVILVFALRAAGVTQWQEVYPGIAVGMVVFLVGSWRAA